MAKNMKVHVLPISIISVVIIVLYLIIGPKPAPDHVTKQPTDRFIRISNASWGLECNPQIEEALRNRANIPLAKDADGKIIQAESLKKAAANNALPVVKTACEGQLTCQVFATDDALGIPLLSGCYKQLDVNYRCSDIDRLVTLHIDQGQPLKIDCTPDASPATPTHP